MTLDNLAAGIELFGGRYRALTVFASAVRECQDSQRLLPLAPHYFAFESDRHWYSIRVFPKANIARLERHAQPTPNSRHARPIVAGAVAASAATSPIFGLLIGATLGAASAITHELPRRIFALRFDYTQDVWQAYEGGLVPWMKATLGAPQVLAGIPD